MYDEFAARLYAVYLAVFPDSYVLAVYGFRAYAAKLDRRALYKIDDGKLHALLLADLE